jgi:cellulose synthase/poly-beta-1,6-N-acetylglucosamine synthase-like glycosyltransferase
MPPTVSIIVPCYNEQKTIRSLLDALLAQTHPRQDLEVVIADGLSTDATRARIAEFTDEHPDLPLLLVDNPKRIIPAGLNLALGQASGEIVVRLDAHSMPHPDYVERCVRALQDGLGENVGGVWEIRPGADTWIGRGIAAAAAHPLGVGDALYRHARKAALVDTVPFGAFKRELLALVGFFDETLLANEDYEFNARVRKSGGRIWLDPAIRSIYIARPDLGSLARQYFRYGFWKWRMLRRYPQTLRWRQGLPPAFVLALLALGGLGFAWSGFWILLGLQIGFYLLILAAAGLQSALRRKDLLLLPGLLLAIPAMHLCWGSGFLWSMIGGSNRPRESKT